MRAQYLFCAAGASLFGGAVLGYWRSLRRKYFGTLEGGR